ncbi:AlpA family phage regulatory protein [Sphingopyxis sp.]|uniref:helix-turn-helix transcriptional regulator n=1 Tax=Sphingopyxis sp. TaxID=1908224 RepID=UPI002D782864|nr:AlpA family phage regulatory protein [Sphingopyxis sp.]HET6526052.1 AlpA family phage regulatory protein [Sphingopyxis sp.]
MKPEVPRFVNIKQVAALFDLSVSTAIRYAASSDFPEPFYFSAGRKVWLLNEVLEWFMNRRGRRAA